LHIDILPQRAADVQRSGCSSDATEAAAMSGTVQREVILPVAPEELWPALTEAERLAEWFAESVRIDLREGGEAVFEWADGARRAVVEEVEVGRRLSFRWTEAEDGGALPSRVELTLEPVEAGTRLRVVESGLAAGPGLGGIAASMAAGRGWSSLLSRLGPVAAARAVH
jgi:uncharacterized protein YndB with AHSA1/START domain